MRIASLLAFLPLVLGSLTTAHADPLDKAKAVVRRFEEEFKNKAHHAIVDELMSPDYKAHGLGPVAFDRAALKQLGKGVVAAFPDVHAAIDSLVAEGDLVVTRCTVTGTHRGPFNGVPATGKPVKFTEMHMYRVRDGRIVEQWSNVDFLAIMTQIGALSPPKP